MRILILTQYFWPENFRINDLAEALQARGHDIVVLTGLPNYPSGHFFAGYGFKGPYQENYHGIPVFRFPLLPRGKAGKWQLIANYLSFALFASVLAPWRIRDKFDALLVFQTSPVTVGLPAVVLKKIFRIPLYFWVQDLWPESVVATGDMASSWIVKIVRSLVKFIYHRCDYILVQSQGFIASITAMQQHANNVFYFPNWAEQWYQPVVLSAQAPERQAIPSGFVVMFAGNIGKAQALETVLLAAERCRAYADIHWVIIGEGREKSNIQAIIEKKQLTQCVHLIDGKPPEAMPSYFALADGLLVTLKQDPLFALTIPSKVQSYLACGKPIIAAIDGEGAQIIQQARCGLVGPAEEVTTLANNVLALYHTAPIEREKMGARGREYYQKHFSRERLLTQLEQWLLRAC